MLYYLDLTDPASVGFRGLTDRQSMDVRVRALGYKNAAGPIACDVFQGKLNTSYSQS